MPKIKECNFHKCIHFRPDGDFGLEVFCETHQDTWWCLSEDISSLVTVANNFPLVKNGIFIFSDVGSDCLIRKIPYDIPR